MVVQLKKQLEDCSSLIKVKSYSKNDSFLIKDSQLKLGGLETSEPVNSTLVEKSFLQFTEKVVECFPIYLHSKKPVKEELTETDLDRDWKAPEPEKPFEKLH